MYYKGIRSYTKLFGEYAFCSIFNYTEPYFICKSYTTEVKTIVLTTIERLV